MPKSCILCFCAGAQEKAWQPNSKAVRETYNQETVTFWGNPKIGFKIGNGHSSSCHTKKDCSGWAFIPYCGDEVRLTWSLHSKFSQALNFLLDVDSEFFSSSHPVHLKETDSLQGTWLWLWLIMVKSRQQRAWRNLEMGKEFRPNLLQPFLENIDRRSCNDGSRELIPAFCNPHRKCQHSPSAVSRSLEYLVGAPS